MNLVPFPRVRECYPFIFTCHCVVACIVGCRDLLVWIYFTIAIFCGNLLDYVRLVLLWVI
jgi:hypothetical protein